MGVSLEWTLIERYMNPSAQPAFINLLRNWGSGYIRVGGGSQDTTPYTGDAPNTDSTITNADFALIRSTMDVLDAGTPSNAVPPWGVVLGTAMTPSSTPANTKSFLQGVSTVFAGAERTVAGISLGNEPDQDGYGTTFPARYLTDFATYSDPAVSGNWPIVVPSTSTDIVPWATLADQAHPSRWFLNWPQILDTVAPTVKARAGVFGPWVSDHFYPFARNCSTQQPWRCATIPLLLGKDHLDALDYLVYTHGTEALAHGVPYRLEETNTSARQGSPGVSDVAASATYAVDMMFHVACPQPPDQPGVNANCAIGGIGMNLQNAARNGNTHPEQGNAYYNVIYFDSSPAIGPPVPAPEYYGALFFAGFAQGTSGLRPVPVAGQDAASISAWRVEAGPSERRLFLINKSVSPVTINVSNIASPALVSRMTPFDPTGAGLTVDASSLQIDGRQVAANGTWSGFAPTPPSLTGGATNITLAAGEAVVVRSAVEGPAVNAGPDASVARGAPFAGAGSFTQNGTGAGWTAMVDYGDGAGNQPLALTGTSFVLGHSYANVGVYSVLVQVTDNAGHVGADTVVVNVVYPASGVFADVNDDGVVTCQDLSIAASIVGKHSGQPGFLPTADIDGNGVIDIRDISRISRLLPAGTHC